MAFSSEQLRVRNRSEEEPGHLGPGLAIEGEVVAGEDLVIDGELTGTLQAPDHAITVATRGIVRGRLFARTLVIEGSVEGSATATGLIEVNQGAQVDADLSAPSIAIAHGAVVNGRIDMRRVDAAARVARYRRERNEEARRTSRAP